MKHRRYSGHKADTAGPPKDQPWTWQSRDLISSPAWRGRTISLMRFIDSLLAENMAHAGTENGRLIQTYDQLEAAGIARRLINRTIDEGEARGLLRVERGGKKGLVENHLNRYRLTWLPTCRPGDFGQLRTWDFPTDEWKRVTPQTIDDWKTRDKDRRRALRKQKTGGRRSTGTVDERPLKQVDEGPPPIRQPIEMSSSSKVDLRTPLSISRPEGDPVQPPAPTSPHRPATSASAQSRHALPAWFTALADARGIAPADQPGAFESDSADIRRHEPLFEELFAVARTARWTGPAMARRKVAAIIVRAEERSRASPGVDVGSLARQMMREVSGDMPTHAPAMPSRSAQ